MHFLLVNNWRKVIEEGYVALLGNGAWSSLDIPVKRKTLLSRSVFEANIEILRSKIILL